MLHCKLNSNIKILIHKLSKDEFSTKEWSPSKYEEYRNLEKLFSNISIIDKIWNIIIHKLFRILNQYFRLQFQIPIFNTRQKLETKIHLALPGCLCGGRFVFLSNYRLLQHQVFKMFKHQTVISWQKRENLKQSFL